MNLPAEHTAWGGVLALVTVLITLPACRHASCRLGLMDRSGRSPVALAGGLAVLGGILTACAAVLLLSPALRALAAANLKIWVTVLGGAVMMTLVGMLDDRHVLRPGPKFLLQLMVALGVAAAGLRVTLFVANPVFQYAVTALWILTVINAFNFMDNMNGLCAGLGVIAAAAFAVLAGRHAQHAEVTFSLIVCGALLGFLPYNYPRARTFLGDAGSHLVGFCMAILAILPSFHTAEDPRPFAVLKPLLILALPLLDMAWMVVLRTRAGKPFYIGDTNHLSHRLVRRGMTSVGSVGTIWLMAAGATLVALLV